MTTVWSLTTIRMSATSSPFKLQKSGYEVRRATDGDEALSSVAAEMPDIVLLDVMMPRPSGLECWSDGGRTGDGDLPVILLNRPGSAERCGDGFALEPMTTS